MSALKESKSKGVLSCVAFLLTIAWNDCCIADWLNRVEPRNGVYQITLPPDPVLHFLEFGDHSYAPDGYLTVGGDDISDRLTAGQRIPIAAFQGLYSRPVHFPAELAGKEVRFRKTVERDAFWDQIITVSPSLAVEPLEYESIEAGSAGSALPPGVRNLKKDKAQIHAEQQSLSDPHIAHAVERELAWKELEALAFPLDFQKVLVASANDSSPGFAFQNGQWLTTWLSKDLPKWTKEDHWFAPALLIDQKLVRPAPLSAKTGFLTTPAGRTLPLWTLEWHYDGITVRQSIFSHPTEGAEPSVYVLFHLENAPADARLALGVGRRPNVHYWDDRERERTPIPFFTLPAGYRTSGRQLVDAWDRLILESAQDFETRDLGPVEMLLTFTADENGNVCLRTPQTAVSAPASRFTEEDYFAARQKFERYWSTFLSQGAQATLPSEEWMQRIDIWKTQLAAITRVHYEGQERLSYGAYFYQAYFGPEEGWSLVALALWGYGKEAQRQAEIMLSAENRSKENVHHQSRNGAFAWYAAEVARLTKDKAWLESIAPALIENAEWTIRSRGSTQDDESRTTRGLLPSHIYGGDIRDPATSLYASAVCWKGLSETAEVFHELAPKSLGKHAERYDREARELKRRLGEVILEVADRNTQPPFLPLALALPSLAGKNEGPYQRLNDSRLGNYWNLFAPSVLELELVTDKPKGIPNRWLFGYMENHGGLWAGLPRFHNGLDAAYSMGVVKELISRSTRDVRYRNQALAGLQSFFLHAASRNGFTIPEVAGLFPYRLDWQAYERLVRESPWNFGMYSGQRYLDGHISFTEPLGAGAGEALWLVRNALIVETRDAGGDLDGGLFMLSTVPSDWYREGREIKLENFPTCYGTMSLHVQSHVETEGRIYLKYQFKANSTKKLKRMVVRLAPPGFAPKDVNISPGSEGEIRVAF